MVLLGDCIRRGSHDGGKIGRGFKGNLILQGQFGKTGKARHGDHKGGIVGSVLQRRERDRAEDRKGIGLVTSLNAGSLRRQKMNAIGRIRWMMFRGKRLGLTWWNARKLSSHRSGCPSKMLLHQNQLVTELALDQLWRLAHKVTAYLILCLNVHCEASTPIVKQALLLRFGTSALPPSKYIQDLAVAMWEEHWSKMRVYHCLCSWGNLGILSTSRTQVGLNNGTQYQSPKAGAGKIHRSWVHLISFIYHSVKKI